MIVDDEDRNRRLLDALLTPEGYEVVQASSGAAALAILRTETIDVVLLDRMMPEMDGVEVCRRIRSELGRVDLPVVFITASADRTTRIAAKRAGADDFLIKPIDENELFARLENLLVVKSYRDLLDRQRVTVEKELERRTAQLLRAERLATVGTLAVGVGHELNNVAQVMTSTLTMIQDSNEPLGVEDLDALGYVADHLVLHASQLLRLGAPQLEATETFDAGIVIESTLSMLKLAGRTKQVIVRASTDASPLWVHGSRVGFEQVVVNLVLNAIDAITGIGTKPRGGLVSVAARSVGSRIHVTVADDGPGMPDEIREHLFDPYFTTKPNGYGTGLGMPVVQHIVSALGGKLHVDSRSGEGTTISVEIALAPAPVAPFVSRSSAWEGVERRATAR